MKTDSGTRWAKCKRNAALRVAAVLFAAGIACAPMPGAGAAWTPDPAARATLSASLAQRWERYFPAGTIRPRLTARELVAFALDGAASGYEPSRVARALLHLRDMQDADPASPTYGNIHWYHGDTRLVDRNGVEFVVRHAALLWLLCRHELTPDARATLESMLRLAATGITRHRVNITYTNIWLMKAWNLIALGEGLPDAGLARQGRSMVREWLDFTRRAGITEYASPTYYGVDIENLALIANASSDAQTRVMAREALDILWNDIALNWYAPAQRLGGVHSRDYNRLYNIGDINALAARAGWLENGRTGRSAGPYDTYAWAPPPAFAPQWLDAPLPRQVSARRGEQDAQRTHHYMGRSFSIGSAESAYHNMDTAPLAVNLGRGQDIPVISFLMEGRRDYYGLHRIVERGSGHLKSLHLRPFVASVQRDAEVLFVAAGSQDAADQSALESVLILPADAEYWLDERKLDFFRHTSRWRPQPAAEEGQTRLAVVRREGAHLLQLADDATDKGVGVQQELPARAGLHYRMVARMQGGAALLYLNFLDASGRLIRKENSLRIAGGEAEQSLETAAPPGTASVRAWLYSAIASTTSVELSELRVEEIADGKARKLAGFDFLTHENLHFVVPGTTTLFVRREDAVLALRPLGAWDTKGAPVPFVLVNDGLAFGALRLTATHSEGQVDGRGAAAIWASAAEGLADDHRFAAFRKAVLAREGVARRDGDTLEARFSGEVPLRLVTQPASGKRLVREGGNSLQGAGPLWINGKTAPLDATP